VRVGARSAVDAAYDRFLGVNNELLTVCTDWQLRDGALNDHSDPAYDAAVVARLRAVDATVQPVCEQLSAALDRFSDYGPRLGRALERVERGDRDWFAKPMIDSYHTVWFELHEDLLATLGIERSREGSTT
jgi:pyruvate,orthophosphate dikinase